MPGLPFSITPTVQKAQVYNSLTGQMIQQAGPFTSQEIDAGAGRFPGGIHIAPGAPGGGWGPRGGGGADSWSGGFTGGQSRIKALPGAPSLTAKEQGAFDFNDLDRLRGGGLPDRTGPRSWDERWQPPVAGGPHSWDLPEDGLPGLPASPWQRNQLYRGFADGGAPKPGETVTVGERGPENVVLPMGGTVIPADQSQDFSTGFYNPTPDEPLPMDGAFMAPEQPPRAGQAGNPFPGIPGKDFRPQSSTGDILGERSRFSTPAQEMVNNWNAMHDRRTSPAQDWLYKNRLGMAAADEAGQFEANKFNSQQKHTDDRWKGREDASMERLKESQKGIAERLADTQKALDKRSEFTQGAQDKRQKAGFDNASKVHAETKRQKDEMDEKIYDSHADILAGEVASGRLSVEDASAILKNPDAKLRQAELTRRHSESVKKAAADAKASGPNMHEALALKNDAAKDIEAFKPGGASADPERHSQAWTRYKAALSHIDRITGGHQSAPPKEETMQENHTKVSADMQKQLDSENSITGKLRSAAKALGIGK